VLRPKVIEDLEPTSRLGPEMHAPDPQGLAFFGNGSHAFLWQDIDRTIRQLGGIAPEGAKCLLRCRSRPRRFGDLTSHWSRTPWAPSRPTSP
jgi:hypothetical protein